MTILIIHRGWNTFNWVEGYALNTRTLRNGRYSTELLEESQVVMLRRD